MKDKFKVVISQHKSAILAALAVMIAYLLMFAVGITCPIKFSLGISCPGCGMTRACVSAVRLDFAAAFEYHPLWVAVLPSAVTMLILKLRGYKRALNLLVCILAVLMLAVYIYRLAFTDSQVVVFAPREGIMPRAFRWTRTFLGQLQ